ncbi:hypothetical protein J7E88_12945 [Streptomyces sp. ISL-10]|uniref:hypothetical protein n=1 Tax=Streptomyces sp. ISL-10 TaxID=2819172 RepID=UPI001BE86281|nr:hypothetical protein [Streptomyces sp. ISL-10]MBT2366191.1 hypothetical protein [Streptomyces sp. ISL-10]
MTVATLDPAAYVVIGEVIHGPHATPVLAEGLFCSIECAADGVRELTVSIGERERGSAFVLWHKGRPVGCSVTRGGQMWVVQVLASHELPTAG